MPQINPISGQESDSSAGIAGDEVGRLQSLKESDPNILSGAEQGVAEDGISATSLTDEEAGYDQAAFDEEADAMDDEDPVPSKSLLDRVIPDAGASADVPLRGPASVKEEVPLGKRQLQALAEEHVSPAEILSWRRDAEEALRQEGIPDEEIASYFGDPVFDVKPMQKYVKEGKDWHAPLVNAPPYSGESQKPSREATTAWESFKAGFQGSMTGLVLEQGLPELEPKADASVLEAFAHGAGQILGDAPGIAVGALAGAPAGPFAAWFMAGAAPAGMRKLLTDHYKKGDVRDASDFWTRVQETVAQMGHEGLVGGLTGAAGGAGGKLAGAAASKLESALAKSTAQTVGSLAGEIMAAGTAPAALEGRLPEKQDFANAASVVIGMHAVIAGTGKALGRGKQAYVSSVDGRQSPVVQEKLMTTYNETGLRPEQVAALAERDPVLTRELVDGSTGTPKSLQWAKDPNAAPTEPTVTVKTIKESTPEPLGEGIKVTDIEIPLEKPAAMAPKATPEGTVAPELTLGGEKISPKAKLEAITPEQLAGMTEKEANDIVRARQLPAPGPDGISKSLNVNELQRTVIDEYDPILRLQKSLTGAKTKQAAIEAIPASTNPYLLARNQKGVVGKAIAAIEYGTFDFKTLKENGESLKTVLKPYAKDVKVGQEFENFLAAARSVELGIRNKESGIDATASVKVYEAGKAKFGKDAKRVVDYQNRILKYATDSGVIGKDEYAAMVAQGDHYVPFKRIIEGEGNGVLGKGLTVKKPVKGIKGSTAPIVAPLESIVRNTHDMIAMAERNRVMTSLRDLMSKHADVLEKVETETGKIVDLDTGEKGTQFRPLRDNEIAVFDEGKRTVYKVADDVAAAIRGMDQPTLGLITKMLSVPASTLRAGATLAPDFLARNVIRDQMHAFVMTRNGYNPITDFVPALLSQVKKDTAYVEWLKGGGMAATLQSIDRDYISANVFKLARETGFMRTAHNVVSTPIELLRHVAELGETPTRIGEFKKATKGKYDIDSTMRGAFDARNVTLDFQRRGAKVSAINSIIPFFNAKNQGLDQLVQGMKERPGTMLLKGAAITVPSVILWAVNHDDGRYKELKDWEKKMFWISMTDDWVPAMPGEQGLPHSRQNSDGTWEVNRGKVFRIPKPHELGLIYGSSVEAGLDAFFLNDPEGASKFAQSVLKQFVPDVPLAPKLAAELTTNHSYFFDRSIVPYDVEKALPHLQYGPSTSTAAKFLSQKFFDMDINNNFVPAPAKVDYAVKGLFGTLGGYGLSFTSWAMEKMGAPHGDVADKDWDSLPFVKAFTIRVPESARSIDDFYKTLTETKSWTDSANMLKKKGETASFEAVVSKDDFMVAMAVKSSFAKASKAMKEIRKQVVQLSLVKEKDMPKEDRLRLTDALLWKRVQIAESAMNEFKAAKKAVSEKRDPTAPSADEDESEE